MPKPTALAERAAHSVDRLASLYERALLVGIESLSDADLLSISLATGPNRTRLAGLSTTLLEEHGGVGGLARLGLGELAERPGVGLASAVRLAAAIELGRRSVQAASLEPLIRLPDRRAVAAWAAPRLVTLDHEELWMLGLDG